VGGGALDWDICPGTPEFLVTPLLIIHVWKHYRYLWHFEVGWELSPLYRRCPGPWASKY